MSDYSVTKMEVATKGKESRDETLKKDNLSFVDDEAGLLSLQKVLQQYHPRLLLLTGAPAEERKHGFTTTRIRLLNKHTAKNGKQIFIIQRKFYKRI